MEAERYYRAKYIKTFLGKRGLGSGIMDGCEAQ